MGSYPFDSCSNLTSVYFMGNAPSMSLLFYGSCPSGFAVYYFDGKTDFTSPTWKGYPTVNMGDPSPVSWLFAHGYTYNTDLKSDTNGDGVNLLVAYALNLDPAQNLAGSIPRPVCADSQLSLKFYAGSDGVTYKVESSSDMLNWSEEGVTLSIPDHNNYRTATINMIGPSKFMRLVIGY